MASARQWVWNFGADGANEGGGGGDVTEFVMQRGDEVGSSDMS